jgi:hypothetical protein
MQNALSFRGSSQTSGSPSAPSARDQTGRFTAPGSKSHRLAGSWANDHGVAAHLSCNASTRVNVLTIVSAIRQAVLACAAGRGWPDLRLRELRVCACHRLRRHTRSLACEDQPSPEGTWSDSACGITLRSGEPQRSLLRQQRTPPLTSARTATAFGLGHNGKGLRASRESPDSGEPLAVRNADRGSAPPAVTAFGQSARDATTRSITVASATVWLPGRKAR